MAQYEGTIPRGGLKKGFWKYVIEVTGERSLSRFLWQGLIFNLFSGFPTVVGSVLRGYAYRGILGHVGSSCLIEKSVRFFAPQRVFLGDRVLICEHSFINASYLGSEIQIKNDVHISRGVYLRAMGRKIMIDELVTIGTGSIIWGQVEIGKYSQIGPQVQFLSERHGFDPMTPVRFQDVPASEADKIVVGKDVFIGANAIVLNGVTLGDGSIIGAGAVVTKDVPSYSMAVGIPARVIRKRE